MNKKPKAEIIGADGNIFHIMGVASRALKSEGMEESAKEMVERIRQSHSYHEALVIVCEYVQPVEVGYKHQEEMEEIESMEFGSFE